MENILNVVVESNLGNVRDEIMTSFESISYNQFSQPNYFECMCA